MAKEPTEKSTRREFLSTVLGTGIGVGAGAFAYRELERKYVHGEQDKIEEAAQRYALHDTLFSQTILPSDKYPEAYAQQDYLITEGALQQPYSISPIAKYDNLNDAKLALPKTRLLLHQHIPMLYNVKVAVNRDDVLLTFTMKDNYKEYFPDKPFTINLKGQLNELSNTVQAVNVVDSYGDKVSNPMQYLGSLKSPGSWEKFESAFNQASAVREDHIPLHVELEKEEIAISLNSQFAQGSQIRDVRDERLILKQRAQHWRNEMQTISKNVSEKAILSIQAKLAGKDQSNSI